MAHALRNGSEGDDVSELQEQLNKLGCMCGVDGVFGDETESAVKRFQQAFQLDADGVVGPATRQAMATALAGGGGGGDAGGEQNS